MRSAKNQKAVDPELRHVEQIAKGEQDELPIGQTPAVLGAKALGIATAIVGVTALVGIEVAYRVLGVKNTDELVDRPPRGRTRGS